MIFTQKNIRAFTLIELVVVITILGILGVISFIGYSGYIVTARDTKRTGDITLINNTIKKLSLQGIDPSNFVKDMTNVWTGTGKFFLRGQDITLAGANYKAGNLAMDAIPDIAKWTIDPKTHGGYRIGTFSNEYEIAGALEDGNTSYILGSYKKRTSSGTMSPLSAGPDTVNNILTLANYGDSLKFRAGDSISTGSTATFTISSMAGTKIYMSGSVVGIMASDQIRLAQNDSDIIGNVSNGATATITDCSNTSMIASIEANLCPISDSTPWLVPYKIN